MATHTVIHRDDAVESLVLHTYDHCEDVNLVVVEDGLDNTIHFDDHETAISALRQMLDILEDHSGAEAAPAAPAEPDDSQPTFRITGPLTNADGAAVRVRAAGAKFHQWVHLHRYSAYGDHWEALLRHIDPSFDPSTLGGS